MFPEIDDIVDAGSPAPEIAAIVLVWKTEPEIHPDENSLRAVQLIHDPVGCGLASPSNTSRRLDQPWGLTPAVASGNSYSVVFAGGAGPVKGNERVELH